MNEFFKKLKQEALTIRLSHNEKQNMRIALYNAMHETPAPAQEVYAVRAVRSTYVWFSPRFALPVAVLLVMGLGTGTAFAAQGSLPGDMLYPVKIHVTEVVEVAIAATPAQKAEAEQTIAGRRVTEAQTLEAQGRLDATTTQELEDNFDEHASRALAFAGEEQTATSSADQPVTVSPTLSTGEANTSPQGGDEGHQAPRATTFKVMSTAQETTSRGETIAATSTQSAKNKLFISLQKQRTILTNLKSRSGQHKRGGEESNNTKTGDSPAATTSVDLQASTSLQTQIESHGSGGGSVQSHDQTGGSGGDNNNGEDTHGKGQSDDGSFIHNLLNNF